MTNFSSSFGSPYGAGIAFHQPAPMASVPSVPRVAPLAQSSSRREFFQRLGLDERNPAHTDLYRMMKDEASAGRHRLSEDRANLTAQSASDPDVRPPYTWDNLQETARHRTILEIYYNARPETRELYERGHYRPGPTDENWIIKWMLWHVFRYRDNRNRDSRNRHRMGNSPDHELSGDAQSSNEGDSGLTYRGKNSGSRHPGSEGLSVIEEAERADQRRSPIGFYDPIRDP